MPKSQDVDDNVQHASPLFFVAFIYSCKTHGFEEWYRGMIIVPTI